MRIFNLVRAFILTLLGIVPAAVIALEASRIEAQVAFPLAGAPYSAGVMARSGSTLAVIGGLEGMGADVDLAAVDALMKMDDRLADIGLNRNNVLRVRAALAPGDGSEFARWNAAWSSFYDGEYLPARTTVGASALPGTARIVLDVVAAFPAVSVEIPGARPALNPNLWLAGPTSNPTSIVSTRAGLFLSSGVLPSGGSPADPAPMEQQMRSAMTGLTAALAEHGLQWYDAFFVRVLPTPQPDRPAVDFPGWTPVYDSLATMTEGNAPAWSMWAAPGFGSSGRYVEIEVWAVPQAPHPAFQVIDAEMQNPLLRMTGEGGAIARGALVAPNAELLFVSGVIAPDGIAPGDEGAAALTLLKERLDSMGASMADVAELRVYRVEGENGFNAAYSSHFNNAETNPHRPVRTNYLVQSLPAGRMVEVEAIVVRPPKRF